MSWNEIQSRALGALFRAFAETVTYTPDRGAGDPFTVQAIRVPAAERQPNQKGYFAAIEVQPADVPKPLAGDLVELDGFTYKVVAPIEQPPNSGFILQLHRQ